MATDPTITLRLPKTSREFVLGVAVFAMVTIGMGLGALFFRSLGQQPFGGYVAAHVSTIAPVVGGIAAGVVASVRWVWHKHESFVASGNSRILDSLDGFKDEISTRLETVEHQVSVTNGSVAEAIRQGIENKHQIELVKAYTRGRAGLPLEDE